MSDDARRDAEKYAKKVFPRFMEYKDLKRDAVLHLVAYALQRDREDRDPIEAGLVKLAEKEPYFDLRHDESGWQLYLYRIDLLVRHDWHDTPSEAVRKALEEMNLKGGDDGDGR